MTYSFGIFYDEFLDYFKEGKGYTAWIASILVGVTLCSGKCPPKKLATHFPTYVKAHFVVVGAASTFREKSGKPNKTGCRHGQGLLLLVCSTSTSCVTNTCSLLLPRLPF